MLGCNNYRLFWALLGEYLDPQGTKYRSMAYFGPNSDDDAYFELFGALGNAIPTNPLFMPRLCKTGGFKSQSKHGAMSQKPLQYLSHRPLSLHKQGSEAFFLHPMSERMRA